MIRYAGVLPPDRTSVLKHIKKLYYENVVHSTVALFIDNFT